MKILGSWRPFTDRSNPDSRYLSRNDSIMSAERTEDGNTRRCGTTATKIDISMRWPVPASIYQGCGRLPARFIPGAVLKITDHTWLGSLVRLSLKLSDQLINGKAYRRLPDQYRMFRSLRFRLEESKQWNLFTAWKCYEGRCPVLKT